jgi:hypothetical protein
MADRAAVHRLPAAVIRCQRGESESGPTSSVKCGGRSASAISLGSDASASVCHSHSSSVPSFFSAAAAALIGRYRITGARRSAAAPFCRRILRRWRMSPPISFSQFGFYARRVASCRDAAAAVRPRPPRTCISRRHRRPRALSRTRRHSPETTKGLLVFFFFWALQYDVEHLQVGAAVHIRRPPRAPDVKTSSCVHATSTCSVTADGCEKPRQCKIKKRRQAGTITVVLSRGAL